MRPVLIIHLSRRRPILSHGQKVRAHVSKRVPSVCAYEGVCLCGGRVGAGQVIGSNVASCNTLKLRICPSLTVQPVLK